MTRQARIAPVAGLCLTIVAAIIPYALYAQITAERLVRANDEPHNWLTYSGSYSSHRHSALRQIDPSNVKKPGAEVDSPDGRCTERFLRHPLWSTVSCTSHARQTTCLRWTAGRGRSSGSTPIRRSREPCVAAVQSIGALAILGDTLYMATLDAQLIAIDRKNGKPVWKNAGSRRERVLLPDPRASGRQGHGHRGSLRRRSRDSGIHRRL